MSPPMVRGANCVALAIAIVGFSRAADVSQPAGTSVTAVLAAADAYLVDYQKQLTFLLADEQSTQTVEDWTGRVVNKRQTSGDLFVTFVEADRVWVAVHDTSRVDDRPVDGHEDIRSLLERDSLAGVARQLVERNARFNIGPVQRNFNEPTLGLLVLEPRRRAQFKFERLRVERVGDADVVTLAFKETGRPTMIQAAGGDLRSEGEIAIESGTGRVRRTFVHVSYTDSTYGRMGRSLVQVDAQLTTTYSRDPNLDLWLPSAFTERYQRGMLRSLQLVKCESTYTNWKRFGARSVFRPAGTP
jgi:hypothetical protein